MRVAEEHHQKEMRQCLLLPRSSLQNKNPKEMQSYSRPPFYCRFQIGTQGRRIEKSGSRGQSLFLSLCACLSLESGGVRAHGRGPKRAPLMRRSRRLSLDPARAPLEEKRREYVREKRGSLSLSPPLRDTSAERGKVRNPQ